MAQLFLDKKDSATIGFVVSCAFAGAIDRGELKAWSDHVLATTDSYPLYIVDLSTFDEALYHIFRVIGFVPRSGLSDTEKDAHERSSSAKPIAAITAAILIFGVQVVSQFCSGAQTTAARQWTRRL